LRRALSCGNAGVEVRAALGILAHVMPKGLAPQEEPSLDDAGAEVARLFDTIRTALEPFPDARGAVAEALMGLEPSANGHAPPEPPEPRCGFVELPPGED
jgi:hypothetical protein